MKIQIKCSCGEGNCPEWTIVEVQGVVEPQPSFHGQLQNLEIGVLRRPPSQESYTFTVGYHELTGTKLSLKKIKIGSGEEESEADVNCASVEVDVIGIISQKFLFKTRPRALITSKVPNSSLHFM